MPGSPISVTRVGQSTITPLLPGTSVGQPSFQSKMGPVKEKLIQTIALMEYQAKAALQECANDCPASDLFAELPELREHMQSLELLKVLQTELDKQEKKVRELEFRVSTEGITSELAKANKEVQSLQEQLNNMEKEKINAEGDKRVEHNKMIEAKRMCEFLQSRVVQVTDEKKKLENDLTIQINKVTFQLTNAKMISSFLEQKLNETKKAKEQSELAASKVEANLKFQLTNAKSISDFVQSKLKQSEEKAKALEAKICKLDFSLTNSQSIGKFMEGKLTQTQNEKKSLQEKVAELESEISSLNVRLALKNDLIERKDQLYKDQIASSELLQKELQKYKGKLNATNKMTAFLQAQLEEAEEGQFSSPNAIHDNPMKEEVISLKSSLELTQKKCESIQKQLTLTQDEKWVAESRVRDLEARLQVSESKWDNAKRSQSKDQVADLEAQVKELTEKLRYAQEALRSAESRATELQDCPVGGDAHSALLDLEFRLTQTEVANKALTEEMAVAKQQKEEADARIRDLERQLQKRY